MYETKKNSDMLDHPFPKTEEILHLSMHTGAYDAVRLGYKTEEYRVVENVPQKKLEKIEGKKYKEIHMFRGKKTEYVRTPWMRIEYSNRYTVLKNQKDFVCGPYLNNYTSDKFQGDLLKLQLGEIIMEGGPLYVIATVPKRSRKKEHCNPV